jgi:hypothetical protein
MDLRSVDLNLITVFNAMMRKRSVTLAGVEQPQPAGVSALAGAHSMTRCSSALATRCRQQRWRSTGGTTARVVDRLRLEVFGRKAFDPRTANQTFLTA